MHSLLRFKLPALVVVGVFSMALAHGVSAQAVVGSGAGCSTYGYNSGLNAVGGQLSCQVLAPTALSAPTTVFVVSNGYNSVGALQCLGVGANYGYTTSSTTASLPVGTGGLYGGQNGCQFQVTSGVVPANAPIGTIVLAAPYAGVSGNVQLTALVCSDPTCGTLNSTALLPPPPPNLNSVLNSTITSTPPPPPPPPPLTNITNGGQPYYPNSACILPGNTWSGYGPSVPTYCYESTSYTTGQSYGDVGGHHHHHHGDSDGDNDGD